mgnify:CR=1 FL=1
MPPRPSPNHRQRHPCSKSVAIAETEGHFQHENSDRTSALNADGRRFDSDTRLSLNVGLTCAYSDGRGGAGGQVAPGPATVTHRFRQHAQHRSTIPARLLAHELITAAHADAHDRTLVSLNARARFGDLPGVTAFDPLSDNNG